MRGASNPSAIGPGSGAPGEACWDPRPHRRYPFANPQVPGRGDVPKSPFSVCPSPLHRAAAASPAHWTPGCSHRPHAVVLTHRSAGRTSRGTRRRQNGSSPPVASSPRCRSRITMADFHATSRLRRPRRPTRECSGIRSSLADAADLADAPPVSRALSGVARMAPPARRDAVVHVPLHAAAIFQAGRGLHGVDGIARQVTMFMHHGTPTAACAMLASISAKVEASAPPAPRPGRGCPRSSSS